MSKVKVAVRVRPLNHRELDLSMKPVIDMRGNQTMLRHPKKGSKTFAYDHCFYSADERDSRFASQELVFEQLGVDVLENAFEGYNACIFAYGQTGSGKSYTMMGGPGHKGIIPRLCDSLFDRIQKNDDSRLTYKVEVSYLEIYNERVRDLLDPRGGKKHLKVREHASLGPYVDGLSKLAVKSFVDIDSLMSEGNKSRTVASTNMNSESSRSHAVFTVIMTQTMFDPSTCAGHEKVSRVSLVDLAGSERLSKTGAEGDRLKEGSNINKSLTTLGLVISALADQSSGKSKRGGFVPYRDSVLTWLLKDSLGGNSKTVMVATASPADDNYEETLSTLRYADRAKRIVNHAIINEDPNAKVIRELREELDRLRAMLSAGTQGQVSADDQRAIDEMKDKLSISERLMKEMTMTWEEKLAQTERIHKERQKALEEMGISIQAGGIGVESGKFYLVNLNADPSLNELLVYYLRVHTRVGRPDANHHPDIQLMGLGILPEHCFLDTEERDLFITPAASNARTFVNGHPVTEKTLLYQGDRILWGNNHFFRVSCDRKRELSSGEGTTELVDYDFARKEIAMYSGDVDSVVKSLEEKYTADKQGALDEQRAMYEKKLAELRDQMASQPSVAARESMSPDITLSASSRGSKADILNDEDEEQYTQEELSRLKDSIISAMELVREANILAEEMGKQVKFKVSLQIPKGCLSHRRRGHPRLDPANEVVVAVNYDKNKSRNTVWSVLKLEDKLIDMRDMYQRLQDGALMDELETSDPFFDLESHTLIGVANVFLECLHHNVPLEYSPPIIAPRGEVCGRLKVEITRVQLPDEDHLFEPIDKPQKEGSVDEDNEWAIKISVLETTGLPHELSNFVFCQYGFYDQPNVVVAPLQAFTGESMTSSKKVAFGHSQVFCIRVTEEFIDYVAYGCLSIEVFGHRRLGFGEALMVPDSPVRKQTSRALSERWGEILRRFEMSVEVLEIDETGEYSPVDVVQRQDNRTGGIFLVKQGQSRRVKVTISPVKGSGSGPLAFERISKMAIGAVIFQNKLAISLDSYVDSGLHKLRTSWSDALMRRRTFLDDQIHKMIEKTDRSKEDNERESALIDEWTTLQWERAAVDSPQRGSGIPGAVSARDKHLSPEIEKKICTVFLDLENELQGVGDGVVVGEDWLLDGEDEKSMIEIPIVKRDEKWVSAVALWDSSVHDNVHLNTATPNKDRIYMVLKVTAQMSHPLPIQLVLRKRVCLKICKKTGFGFGTTLLKKFGRLDTTFRCGMVYEIAAGIPKQAGMDRPASPDPERMLADEDQGEEEVLERYSRGVSSVQSILALDKLRQEVAVKERLAEMGKPLKKLPMPIPPKLLSSLSRADSGMLDTMAIGDETEEDTLRTPTETRTRGVSPGCLATALSSLDEVSETNLDESGLFLSNTSASFKQTSPEIEIENRRPETVEEIQRERAVFSSEVHTSPFPVNSAFVRTSTPIVSQGEKNKTTDAVVSEPLGLHKVRTSSDELENKNKDIPFDGVSQVEPLHGLQISRNDGISEVAAEWNENHGSAVSEARCDPAPPLVDANQSTMEQNQSENQSSESQIQCHHPQGQPSQSTQANSQDSKPFPVENQPTNGDSQVALPEPQPSEPLLFATHLQSDSEHRQSESQRSIEPESQLGQNTELLPQQNDDVGPLYASEKTEESPTGPSIWRECESSGWTGEPNGLELFGKTTAHANACAEDHIVEEKMATDVEDKETIEEQTKARVKEDDRADEETAVTKDAVEDDLQVPNQVHSTDEHHVPTEIIGSVDVSSTVADKEVQQSTNETAVDQRLATCVIGDSMSESRDETPNVIVKDTMTESNGDVVPMEGTNTHDVDRVTLEGIDRVGIDHEAAVRDKTHAESADTLKNSEVTNDKFKVTSVSLDAHGEQNFSEGKAIVEKAEHFVSDEGKEKAVELETTKPNHEETECKTQSTEIEDLVVVPSDSLRATDSRLLQEDEQRLTSESVETAKGLQKSDSRPEHKSKAVKEQITIDEADQSEIGDQLPAIPRQNSQEERAKSSPIERVDRQDPISMLEVNSYQRADTPSEASDSGSVASSTDLLDEAAAREQYMSDTPPVDPAPVADAKPEQTVAVGEVVMADLGKQGYKMGIVKFVGQTQFQTGDWVGVALDRPHGKHNGTIQGVSYFKCKPKHGVFVRMDKIMKAPVLSSAKPTLNSSVSASSISRSPLTARRSSMLRRTSHGSATTAPYRLRRNTGLK